MKKCEQTLLFIAMHYEDTQHRRSKVGGDASTSLPPHHSSQDDTLRGALQPRWRTGCWTMVMSNNIGSLKNCNDQTSKLCVKKKASCTSKLHLVLGKRFIESL